MGTRGSAQIRAREFAASARILGLAARRMLDIPDGRIEASSWTNKLKIIRVLRAYRPKIVFAPYWADRHPDHEEASQLVRRAAYLSGLVKIETGRPPFRPYKVIYCAGRYEFTPSFIVDISGSHEQKMKAVRAYKSQFHSRDRAEPESDGTLIGRPDFLEGIEARDTYYGAKIGVQFGEAFRVRETIKVVDPVEFFGPECLWARP
jgi:bacillithiol biosynthesis deacetylase BshB1